MNPYSFKSPEQECLENIRDEILRLQRESINQNVSYPNSAIPYIALVISMLALIVAILK
jgi:hypothetical protein